VWGLRVAELLLGEVTRLQPGCQLRFVEAPAVQEDSLGVLVGRDSPVSGLVEI
jgi:hypothetical protein